MRLRREASAAAEINRLAEQAEAMIAAAGRMLSEAQAMPGLGDIRADRSIPIKERRHSIPRRSIR